jgi:hypothetical protein
MIPPMNTHLQRMGSLLLAWIIILACSLSPLHTALTATPAAVSNQSTGAATQANNPVIAATPEIKVTSTPQSDESDPLDRLLTLRSIKFDLTSLKWDGSSYSIDVEIDSAGNMRVSHSRPAIDPDILPKGIDPKSLPASPELYVVDGKAYLPGDENPGWMTKPVYENYLQMLTREIHGPGSPALWLDLLPIGSINPAGKDTVGGFAVDKYTVNGQVDEQTITGTIWFEPQADALVQAELHVPAALMTDPSSPQKGELKITLNAQKADVPPVSLPAAPSGPAGTSVTPAAGSPAPSSGTLAISNSYPLQAAGGLIGVSLAASPGKVWIGSGKGTVEEVDSQSGAFKGITLDTSGGQAGYVLKLRFDGQYIAALEHLVDQKHVAHGRVFAIDSGSGAVVQQWDLESSAWSKQPSENPPMNMGVSPGKIWVDNHVIDTQAFETKEVDIPGDPQFAYNGKDWMWMTGDTGGSCNDLVFVNTDDPSRVVCQKRLPFINNSGDKVGAVYIGLSVMASAGDRMWMAGRGGGSSGPNMTLNAYPADMDQLLKQTKPLNSVVLMDKSRDFNILYAGNYLWLLWFGGDQRGFLYQLDPQTGATINSLDLVGDKGRGKGDIPHGIATEGNNLWVLTTFQLLRIQLP